MADEHTIHPELRAALSAAPVAIISAVIGASPSNPLGIAQEIGAAVARFQQAASELAGNPLIAATLVNLKGSYEHYEGAGRIEGEHDIFALAGNPEAAIAMVQRAGELASRHNALQAEEYRHWLIDLAHAVARAAREGGFLGIGGEPVSTAEQAILDRISAVLS